MAHTLSLNANDAARICNHFSAMLPGSDRWFLVNAFGLAFEEITASNLLVCDVDGHVVAGDGVPEAIARRTAAEMRAGDPQSARAHLDSAIRCLRAAGVPFDS